MPAHQTRRYTTEYRFIQSIQFQKYCKDGKTTRFKGFVGDLPVSLLLEPKQVGYGFRYYFVCPYCESFREKLYIVKTPICRKCADLHIPSNTMTPSELARYKIRKARREIWGNCPVHSCEIDNLLDTSLHWGKPKGMHQRTFDEKHRKLWMMENEYVERFLIPELSRLNNQLRGNK